MGFGAAATLKLIGAVFQFIAEVFKTVGGTAVLLGDPEISTPCAFVVVALVAAGPYTKALAAILVSTLIDLLAKEFPELPVLGSPN